MSNIIYDSGMVRENDDDKLDYTLCDLAMLKRWAEHMTKGEKKYSKRNFEKANSKEELARFRRSAFRHFAQWLNDEKDEDHAAAVFFNIAAYEACLGRLSPPPLNGIAKIPLRVIPPFPAKEEDFYVGD
jgi:hypothetical protein